MKKGYTLIELLAVIVLLGIVTTITVVNVNEAASARAAEDYKKLKEIIEASAEIYADENDAILNKLSSVNSCKFPYQKLIDAKLVDSDQKDPRTKKILSGDKNYIVVTVQSGYKLKYTFINGDAGETTSAQNCQ